MHFLSLGSCVGIGASCHYISVGETGLVLDAGADPNKEGPPSMPEYHRLGNLNLGHALITHAHHDHIGGIPSLAQRYSNIQIHLTRPTSMVAYYMLKASARLQERKFQEGSSEFAPLFDKDDVDDAADLFVAHKYQQAFPLSSTQDVSAEFYDAGHVLGSAGVLLRVRENGQIRSLFYTGDTNIRNQTIIPSARYPSSSVDVLVMESTLGADPHAEHTTRTEEERRFCETLVEVIDRGGCALVPVFMLGRSQEILALIHRFKQKNLIPADLPVYTAGGMRAIADIYDKTRDVSPRIDPLFQVFQVKQRSLPRKRSKLTKALNRPGIFVLASGMLFANTLSNRIAQRIIENEKHAILLVGYCKEDSPGGQLLEAWQQEEEGVILNPKVGMQPIDCQIDRFRFSGHSNRRDLVALVGKLNPKKVVLVHGDEEARTWVGNTITSTYPGVEVLLPAVGESLEL